MHLFSRRVSLTGPPGETMTFARDLAAAASKATGREIALWGAMFGAARGTYTFSARVQGVADCVDLGAKSMADDNLQQRITKGQHYYAGPVEDRLLQPIVSDFGAQAPPVGSFVSITNAVIANGAYEDAIAWGVEVAQHAAHVTGRQVIFARDVYGKFGAVTWVGIGPDAAAVDASLATLDADVDYLKMLSRAASLFIEGSGHQLLLARLA